MQTINYNPSINVQGQEVPVSVMRRLMREQDMMRYDVFHRRGLYKTNPHYKGAMFSKSAHKDTIRAITLALYNFKKS